MKVEIINQLKDNYSFVLYNDTLKSCVIDPADSNPILNFALEKNLTVEDIFITHHHKDHTSGVKGILNAFPEVNIHSPSAQIENTRFVLRDGDEVNSCLNTFRIIKTPGHTLDHIIYYDENNGVLFCGDTLFRLGCGRVFEGTLNEMFNSLKKINELDKNTIIYCGHEYTISNLNFLEKTLKKESAYLTVRNKVNDELNTKGKSLPFLLEDEKQYNLFLNQNSKLGTKIKKELGFTDFELFTYLRRTKDSF
ncbi:hydroxyacylglutathione hydrolase [Pelagibacteraceae bacterium]|nr:hydroxyacylglutathione hydrolase [Pelagibacteraceae bacterium]